MYAFTLRLTKEAANGLRAVAPASEVRYYLCGYAIDLDAKRITATDGARLLSIPFSNPGVLLAASGEGKGNTGIVIVPRLPRKTSGDVAIHLERGDDVGPVTIYAEYFTAAGKLKERLALESIDGRFPDLDRVIPADGDCAAFDAPGGIPAFNATYLADVAAAISPKYQSVRIRPQRGELARTSPFRVEFPGSPLTTDDPATSVTYIVMPVRD